MQISGYGMVRQLDPYSELEQIQQQRRVSGLDDFAPESKGDTVSFSAEGRRLAAQMLAAKADAQTASGVKSAVFTETDKQSGAAGAGTQTAFGAGAPAVGPVEQGEDAQGGGSAGSGDSGSESDADDIEAQIKALESQLQSILGGSLPDDLKQVTAQPVQQQIVQLQQQLNQLKAQAAKG